MNKSKMTIVLTCNGASEDELIQQLPLIYNMLEGNFHEGEILIDMNENKVGNWTAKYSEHKPSRQKSGMYAKVSLEKKLEFINSHLVLFDQLFEIFGTDFNYNKANIRIRVLAAYARKELGYSETTYAPDIMLSFYSIYLKNRKNN